MGETFFWGKKKCHWWRDIRTASNKQNWRKHCKNLSNCAWKSLADCQMHNRASEHWQTNSQQNLNWRSWHEEGVCKDACERPHQRTKAKRSHNLPRPFGEATWHFGPCHHRWWNMGLPIRSWNKAAKCTMEDCQFPTTKNIPSVQIKSKQCCWLFLILEGLFVTNLYQLDKQSTKFTIWKYWKGCVKKLDGKDLTFLPTTQILHHDNARAHTALSVRLFLATKQIIVLEHPAYSPDRSPNDFFLFPKIKKILKGRHFDDIDDIRSNKTAALKAIPQNQFQNCFE